MQDDPRYADINNVNYPPCSREEAERAAKRILRSLGRKSQEYPAQINDARPYYEIPRRCWVSPRPTSGVRKGWGRLIHDLGHVIFRARRPNSRPHDHGHEAVEREVLLFCQNNGFFDGAARREVKRLTTAERRKKRLTQIASSLKRWESKKRRAETAIKKLTKEQRRIHAAIIKDETGEVVPDRHLQGMMDYMEGGAGRA